MSRELTEHELSGAVAGIPAEAAIAIAEQHGLQVTDGKVIDRSPVADGSLTEGELSGVVVGIPAEAAAQIAVNHGVEVRNVPR